MIRAELREFMDRVIDQGRIGPDDVRQLQRNVLGHGVTSREEAEALLSLDRNLETDSCWREILTVLIVDFVVWGSRPTGVVTAETTRWLAAALDAADLTETALHIAYAVVEEAHDLDEALLTFILRGRQHARRLKVRVPPANAGKPPLPVRLKVL